MSYMNQRLRFSSSIKPPAPAPEMVSDSLMFYFSGQASAVKKSSQFENGYRITDSVTNQSFLLGNGIDEYIESLAISTESNCLSLQYSVQEMRSSRMAGKSLDVQKGKSAHYQIDYLENKIAWAGDAANKLMGVLTSGNNIPYYTLSSVTVNGSSSTKWEDKTADQIVVEINAMQKFVSSTTKGVERPDTLVLPSDVFMDISTRRIPDTETTVKDFILAHAPYLKAIEEAAELNADSYDTNPLTSSAAQKGVAFLYTNNAEKFSIETPMPFYQYALQVRNLEMIIPCEARTAGVIIYYPLSALIAIGV